MKFGTVNGGVRIEGVTGAMIFFASRAGLGGEIPEKVEFIVFSVTLIAALDALSNEAPSLEEKTRRILQVVMQEMKAIFFKKSWRKLFHLFTTWLH